MNTDTNSKDGSSNKIIAAITIVIVMVFMIGIVISASINEPVGNNKSEADDKISNSENTNGDTDSNNDGTADNFNKEEAGASENEENSENVNQDNDAIYIPKFTNRLTGLECFELNATTIPYAILIDPNAPLYGISGSDVTIEIPTECGGTRLVIFRTDITTLGKIGALSQTRDYIGKIVSFFGGILVSRGNDDIINEDDSSYNNYINLNKYPSYIYKENGKNSYTDNQSITTITNLEGISTNFTDAPSLPYLFVEFNEVVIGKTVANKVTLPYSADNESAFIFNEENNVYSFIKGDRYKIDMLNGETAAFTNVFVLFANSVTYELSSGTQTILDIDNGGGGYYISHGTLTEIRWTINSNNELEFKTLNGEVLTINRGNSYIGYYKASDMGSVIFE